MHETDRRVLELMRGEAKASPKDKAILKGMRLIGVRVADADEVEDGGAGSGNFGHSGRPGQIGGSGEGGGSSSGGGAKAEGKAKASAPGKRRGLGTFVHAYPSGTEQYSKKGVVLGGEDARLQKSLMGNVIKREVTEDIMKKMNVKRSDVDINMDDQTVTVWTDNPKSRSGITKVFCKFDVLGDVDTYVKADGKKNVQTHYGGVKVYGVGADDY